MLSCPIKRIDNESKTGVLSSNALRLCKVVTVSISAATSATDSDVTHDPVGDTNPWKVLEDDVNREVS